MTFNIHHGDCLEVLKTLETGSIDAIVTDPPYGLTQNKGNNPSSGGFMGKKWDNSVPGVHIWLECLRVLKPGGHLLAFGGARTYHRLAVAIEDAGFEIRDQIMWVYGQGFPKNHNVSKAIDKAAGKEREVIGAYNTHRDSSVRVQRVYNGIADEGKYLAGKQGGGLTPITAPVNFGPLEPKEGEVTEIVDVELKCRECSERQWVNFKPYDPKERAPLFRTPAKESIV